MHHDSTIVLRFDLLRWMPGALTDVWCLLRVKAEGDIDRLIAMLRLKAFVKVLVCGEARIDVKCLFFKDVPLSDPLQSELTDVLSIQVEGDHLPVTVDIEDMVGMPHTLRLFSAAGCKVDDFNGVVVLDRSLYGKQEIDGGLRQSS